MGAGVPQPGQVCASAPASTSNAARVTRWLRQRRGNYYCQHCISRETGVTPIAQVNQIVRPLQQAPKEWRYGHAPCSGCGRERKLSAEGWECRALLWRDRVAALLPPPRKFKKRFVLNTTGVIGVTLARQRTRGGRLVEYYCATWFDERGQRRKRSFSVAKYGRREARALAIDTRRNVLAVLLRPAGRGGASDGRQRERPSR